MAPIPRKFLKPGKKIKPAKTVNILTGKRVLIPRARECVITGNQNYTCRLFSLIKHAVNFIAVMPRGIPPGITGIAHRL